MRFKVTPFKRHYAKPIAYKTEKHYSKEGFYLCLADGEAIGIGEISPLPFFSNESLHDTKQALDSLRVLLHEWVIPESLESIKTMLLLISDLPTSVQCGLEMALLTLLSDKRGISLARTLSEKALPSIKINSLISSANSHYIHTAMSKNFECHKLKVGRQSFEEDMAFIFQIMSLIKSHHTLKIDCNGLWSLNDAIRFSKAVDHKRIRYIEDPFPDIATQKKFTTSSSIKLALDEYYESFDQTLYSHSSYFVIKPMVQGSIVSLLTMPQTTKNKLIISSSYETEIGLLGLLHLAACFGNDAYHGLDTLHYFKETHPSLDIQGTMTIDLLPTFRSLIKKEWIPN